MKKFAIAKKDFAKGEIIEGLKEGRWVHYHEKFDDMEQARPNDFESNIVFYKKYRNLVITNLFLIY